MADDVTIERGLPDRLREPAAAIFDEAFGEEIAMAVPSAARRLAFLQRSFAADHTVIALVDGELAGLVGLSSTDGAYVGGLLAGAATFGDLRAALGVGGAVRAALGLHWLDHKPTPGELYIDGIAVTSSRRSRGIGSRLLAEAVVIAREAGFRWVRLEVLDTNPRAQALYEALGYRITNVRTLGFMRHFVSFDSVTSMELAVDIGRGRAAS